MTDSELQWTARGMNEMGLLYHQMSDQLKPQITEEMITGISEHVYRRIKNQTDAVGSPLWIQACREL